MSLSNQGGIAETIANDLESTSSLAGRVLVSNDSLQGTTPSEIGIASVKIELLDEQGLVLDHTLTDESGNYEFNELPAGIYALQEQTPTAYLNGTAQVGSAGGIVFTPDLIGEIVVTPGTPLTGYNFYEISSENPSEHLEPEGEAISLHSGTAEQSFVAFVPLPQVESSLPKPFMTESEIVLPSHLKRERTGQASELYVVSDPSFINRGRRELAETDQDIYDFDAIFDELFLQLSAQEEEPAAQVSEALLEEIETIPFTVEDRPEDSHQPLDEWFEQDFQANADKKQLYTDDSFAELSL